MTKLLLSVHVIAAILAIGPVAVAASLFPRYARDGAGPAAFLHRITRGYAVLGVAVPVFGAATGAQMGVLTDAWLIVSVVLTAAAAAILGLAILPGQRRMLGRVAAPVGADTPPAGTPQADAAPAASLRAEAARLSMLTGAFNLLWAVVVVLMIVRPGSTTGA